MKVDDYVDGKGCGWYNYDDTAAATVDGVWSEWNTTKNDEFLSVRCVHSGHFDYAVWSGERRDNKEQKTLGVKAERSRSQVCV